MLLERHDEGLWLGQTHWAVGINLAFQGHCHAALEAERCARSVGEARGDPRLQTYADWASGWALAMLGRYDEAIAACERSLAASRDSINTMAARGWLGFAYREKGDLASALPALSSAAEETRRMGYRTLWSYFDGQLGDAHHSLGQLELAREFFREGLDIARDVKFSWGAAYSLRGLGRIAAAEGDLPEAESRFRDARDRFLSIEAPFEAARTQLDLAALAGRRGDRDVAGRHLTAAREVFLQLGIPEHVDRAERLAADLGIALAAGPHRS